MLWDLGSGQSLFDFDPGPIAPTPLGLAAGSRLLSFRPRLAAADIGDPPPTDEGEPAQRADAWTRRGAALEAVDGAAARDAYRQALTIEPDFVAAHLNLGRLLHEAGELDAAEVHYRAARAAAPDDVIAAFDLGVVLEDRGQLAAARAAYEGAVQLDSAHGDAVYNLAMVCEKLGDEASAIRHLQAYRRLTKPN